MSHPVLSRSRDASGSQSFESGSAPIPAPSQAVLTIRTHTMSGAKALAVEIARTWSHCVDSITVSAINEADAPSKRGTASISSDSPTGSGESGNAPRASSYRSNDRLGRPVVHRHERDQEYFSPEFAPEELAAKARWRRLSDWNRQILRYLLDHRGVSFTPNFLKSISGSPASPRTIARFLRRARQRYDLPVDACEGGRYGVLR